MIYAYIFLVLVASVQAAKQEILGYLENWGTMTKWWDNVIPGNCNMGCEKPDMYIKAIANYTTINYGFVFLTENPNPDQVSCGSCPVWDGNGIYIAKYSQWGSKASVVTANNDLVIPTSGAVSIMESCRLARQGYHDNPKRCNIALGGWSDWARLATTENAEKVASLVGRMVLSTFADGVDLDFEHLTPFSNYSDEFAAFTTLIQEIQKQFSEVIPNQFVALAKDRKTWYNNTYNNLPNWEKKQGQYFPTNIQYMDDIINNIENQGLPKLTISWTTRFNAFVPTDNVWNYLMPNSPIPDENFETDNEGTHFWNEVKEYVDKVNIMAYDAGTPAGALVLNFTQILENFVAGGVRKEQLNMGFEPGTQAAGGVWEGQVVDQGVTKIVKDGGYGGVMIWAVNNGANTYLDEALVNSLSEQISPDYPYYPVPTYSEIDPQTGWLKNMQTTKVYA